MGVKALTGDFVAQVFRFKCWWVVEDETLVIHLFKSRLALLFGLRSERSGAMGSWKHPFTGQNTGMFRRQHLESLVSSLHAYMNIK